MKTWQKVQVSPRCMVALLFGLAMFALGVILGIAQERYVNGKRTSEHVTQPQTTLPPTPDSVKPPSADVPKEPSAEPEKRKSAKPPKNILGDIYDNTHGGMTVAELDAVVAKQALYKALERPYVQKQRMPPEKHPPNGMDVEIRVWTWEDSEDARGDRWVTELRVDIFDDVVAGRIYSWRQEVNRGVVWRK